MDMETNHFTVTRLSEHLWRIVDPLDVACYLAVGETGACLLDTCTGVGDLKSCVESITKLPLTVVLSHAHMDHCGGAGQFGRAYMSHREMPILAIHQDIPYRCSFFNSHLGLSLQESDFPEVPEDIYTDIPGDMTLDLGGVTVELLLTPGHTPGMIVPLIPEDRAVIISDACDDNVLLFDRFSSSVRDYMKNLQRIIDMGCRYDHIYGNHGVFTFPRALIGNVVQCCQRILSRTDDRIPTKMLGAEMYSSCPIGPDGLRLDGKPGNVLYSDEKVD